jgi:RNA polymerase sigma-70 factor (ECF subfamily)
MDKINTKELQEDSHRQRVVEALVREYGDAIIKYCKNWLDDGLAEEVAQNVFIILWEKLLTIRSELPIQPWLFGIAKNKCQQAYRNQERRRAIIHTFAEDIRRLTHIDPQETLEHSIKEELRLTRLHDSLTRLRDEEKILLNLRYWKGYSTAEISDLLNMSESNVRKRLERVKRHLRKNMQDTASE